MIASIMMSEYHYTLLYILIVHFKFIYINTHLTLLNNVNSIISFKVATVMLMAIVIAF